VQRLCRKWNIVRLDAFGSVLRTDFAAESDVDLLVTFDPVARITLLDLDKAESEFSRLLGRKVDLVSRIGVEASQNWIRKGNILDSAVLLFAA
jgi:predicted nucleotidyltransferase